jgi:signal transduction histidine kinase
MASLGSMVAGISHEVNNPLGVCLTTVSAFRSRVDKIQRAYVNENLTKTQFVAFLDQYKDATVLVEENLQRAIQTISSFKNMAINQMQDEKELINFCDFILTIKETFKYELKKKNVAVDIVCGDNILLLGYPGALSQIFTNLILNSLIHGFVKEQDVYKIQVKAAIIERMLVVEYRDNGTGIPEEVLNDIFKLFFTTKKEQGGSGIGLHIVRNLLKEKFDGSITCVNNDEGGVVFTIRIPITNH